MSSSANAELPQPTAEVAGLTVAQEADARYSGFGDMRVELKMILRDGRGRESLRRLRIKTVETGTSGERSVIVFDEPRDIQRTALLTHSFVEKPDDQWLYLPVLKRVKRISSRNRSGPFVASEFAYEDMASQEVPKYSYLLLGTAPCGELQCYQLQRTPLYEGSGYKYQVALIDTEELRLFQVDYFVGKGNREGRMSKTLTIDGYRRYDNRFWRPAKMVMTNHKSGRVTELHWSNYQFGVGLSQGEFSQVALKRLQ